MIIYRELRTLVVGYPDVFATIFLTEIVIVIVANAVSLAMR